tara:strand:+ start:446 stop:631 length:186 start_codon:yes stop_codon:yes gene_type:complete
MDNYFFVGIFSVIYKNPVTPAKKIIKSTHHILKIKKIAKEQNITIIDRAITLDFKGIPFPS